MVNGGQKIIPQLVKAFQDVANGKPPAAEQLAFTAGYTKAGPSSLTFDQTNPKAGIKNAIVITGDDVVIEGIHIPYGSVLFQPSFEEGII